MSLQASKKHKLFNILYSGGASIVLLGALFKLTHFNIGPITGNLMLTLGLVTEAVIFAFAAFDAPSPQYEWEKVYPELAGGMGVARGQKEDSTAVEVALSKKLDKLMEDAKLDVALIGNLKTGIDKFKASIDEFGSLTSSTASSQKYTEQLSLAANHMETLNSMYAQQMHENEKLLNYNKELFEQVKSSAEKSADFSKQMGELTLTLANMNKVYAGMLNAMKTGA